MPKVPSTTSTRWLETPSDGALPTLYGMHLAQESWQPHQLEAFDWEVPSKQYFRWSLVDETTDGSVQFVMTVDMDAPTPADVSQDAWYRMLCVYIVGHLSGKPLAEACQSLADNYAWQIGRQCSVPQISEQRRHAVSQVRRVERVPFAFDET